MMLFLFDENVPHKLVEGLSLIEEANFKSPRKITIAHPRGLKLEGASDEILIACAGQNNGVIISMDKDFKHMKSYYPLYRQFKVGVVVFNLRKSESNYWGLVKAVIQRWEELKAKVFINERPFIFEITSKGLEARSF